MESIYSILTSSGKFFILGVLFIASVYAGMLVRKVRLPSLIGFMILGILAGPHSSGLISHDFLEELSFFSDLALGFVALSIGAELSLPALRRQGSAIWAIIVMESVLTFVAVALAIGLITGNWPLALLLGGIAPASAPAGTVAIIQEYKAKGPLTSALYSVVGFDDGLGIVIFGFASAAAFHMIGEAAFSAATVLLPVAEILGSLAIGTCAGFLFGILSAKLKSDSDLLTLITGFILVSNGLSEILNLSLILTNLAAGIVAVNTQSSSTISRMQKSVSHVMPIQFVIFFMLAGAHLNPASLIAAGFTGMIYLVARIIGKISGAWTGSAIGKADPVIRKNIGPGILSQAGVSIGLALIVQKEIGHTGSSGVEMAAMVITTITATSILFEIGGPLLTRAALRNAGEIQ